VSLSLVIGATRSGKSAHGERLALATGLPVRYVATADDSDPLFADRIAEHVERRPAEWTTVVAEDSLAEPLAVDGCVLLDGLGVWIAGALHRAGAFEDDAPGAIDAASTTVRSGIGEIVAAAQRADVVVVAEEPGAVNGSAASRAWADLLGEATQAIAAKAQRVERVTGGRAQLLTPPVDDPRLRVHGDTAVRPGDADHAVTVLAGGPPDWVLDVIATTPVDRYPSEDGAIRAIAALHGRAPEEVVPTNGAAEALWLLGPALRPALAACVHPAFTETEAALRVHGVPVVRVQRDPGRGFALDPSTVPDEADLVVVGNPASPSGTLETADAVKSLRRPGRVLVVDEAFMTMVQGEQGSLAAEALDDVIVVRSLTKALAVPGLRVGYALAPAQLAEKLRAVRPPWSANSIALAILEAAVEHPATLQSCAARAGRDGADLDVRLRGLGLVRTWPSATNYRLVEVPDGPAVVSALRDRSIAVRMAGSFPGLTDNHLRITARDAASNQRLVDALKDALG